MSPNADAPTAEERAKFLLNETIDTIGYADTIQSAIGNGVPSINRTVDTTAEFLENLEHSHSHGVEKSMQNKRENGFSPIAAWENQVDGDWPDWYILRLAQHQYEIFQGDPEFLSDEEQEYLEFLEEQYGVPR